ncbi:HTH domain-containing protein [Streptomyces sp. NPDC050516]|uniref:HTH domain-containing protein n=1 Tax=Streptomyces sp. NPDC050516 TaxID=3365621 RepID=UPI0037944A2E
MLTLLRSGGEWTAADLTERLGTSARTVRRDAQRLRRPATGPARSPGTRPAGRPARGCPGTSGPSSWTPWSTCTPPPATPHSPPLSWWTPPPTWFAP